MSDPSYNENTTYIIYTANIGLSFEDLANNVYVLDQNFPIFTYSNSDPSLVPTFGIFQKSGTEASQYNNMVEVVLGDNIEAGICKFYNCSKLESVTINYRNDRISMGAFAECTNLKSVTIPHTIRSIEELAFYNCNVLKTFNFNNITYIGFSAFQECQAFTDISFNNNSYFFVSNSFDNCRYLTDISFTNDKCVGVIQPNAFVSSGLTSVTLPPNMLYTLANTNEDGGSFPPDCDVSGGRIGFGVVGNFKLTSNGTDSNGNVVTTTATTSGTSTGATTYGALSRLLSTATTDFIVPKVSGFVSKNGSGSTTYTLDFTIGV